MHLFIIPVLVLGELFCCSTLMCQEPEQIPVSSAQAEILPGVLPGDGSVKPAEVVIVSSFDDTAQHALFFSPKLELPRPLLVVLHSWSGNYLSEDPLAPMAIRAGWNYIHPDFRGPNCTADACLSNKVLADIEDAIQYALDNGKVDKHNIFVVGASGGGHAALGVYLRTRHPVKLFLAWVPISDLTMWYWQSKSRNNKYAQDILLCTSPAGRLDEEEARRRSPLYWEVSSCPGGRLEIYAGIHDGYTGSVPVSHSVLFFNKLVELLEAPDARVPDADLVKLLSRGITLNPDMEKIGGRDILYKKNIPEALLAIFDGGHEMLAEYCFSRLLEAATGIDP